MVEELKLAIKVDDDAIEQSLLKQFSNAEKMANKVVLTFNNIDLDDKAIEAKFKEMQKMAGKNPIDLSIDKSSIEMLSAISKQLGNIFDIAKGKSIIDSSATAQIDKLQSKLDELTKKYNELSSKKIGSTVSGKGVDLVDNEEFKLLAKEVENVKQEIDILRGSISQLVSDNVSVGNFADKLDDELRSVSDTVSTLTSDILKLQQALDNTSGIKTNISSENNDLQNTIEILKQLSKLPGGDTLSLGKIMDHIAEGAKLANPEVKKLLESLKLLDSEGKIIGTHINEGTLNSGVDLNDTFAIISRNDAIENVDKLIAKEKEAQQQGILLARTLASVDIGKLHYDIQELAQGSSVHQMKNSTLQQFIDETRVLCNATDEQILKLYSDAQKLSDLGFKLDLNPSNIRYDENSGFSFIDLELRKINEEAPQTVAIMHTLTQSLMGFMGQRNRLNWDDEENFYTKDNYLYLQNMLKTYEHLQQIFSSKLSTPDFNQAFSDSLQLVKTRIAGIEAHFENLGTPIKDVFQGDTKSNTDASTTAIKEESKALEQVSTSAKEASESKDKFVKANKEVKASADSSKTSISEEEKYFNSLGKSLGQYQNTLAAISRKPANGNRSQELQEKIDIISSSLEKLNALKSKTESDSYVFNKDDVKTGKELEGIIKNNIELVKQMSTAQKGSDSLSRGKEIDTITKYLNKFTGISKQAKQELKGLLDQLQSGDPSVNVKKIHERFLELTVAEREAGREGRTWLDIFKDKKIYSFLGQAASMFSFYDLVNVVRQAGQTVIDLNTNITELAKVSEESASQIYDDFNSYVDIAKEVGGTISDTISATADWSRNGYNIPDAKELAEVAMIYKNVGDGIDIDQANEYLISTLRGFKLEAKDAMDIIDSINEVANNEPISSAGIGEALQRSAAAFNVANTSLQESIALVTSTNSVLQSPEKVGSMWTTVSARIRGAKTELEDAGLETDGMVESTSKLQSMIKGMTGFDILEDDQKTFKSIYDIIIGIGEEFQNLSGVDQAALLEALAGKRQSNALAATLNNIDLLKKAYGEATNAEGSAMAEQEKYQQSIQYSIDRTKASLEELANDFISSDFLKGLIDFGDKLINILDLLIDKFGVLGTTAIIGGGILGGKNIGREKCYPSYRICL